MKKLIMFLVLIVSIVSLGLTIYYFSIDNEVISIKSSYLVVDKQDSIYTSDLLSYKNKNETTQYEYTTTDNSVLEYVGSSKAFVAKSAGTCEIVINTSNRAYSRLSITVRVCDGSEENPYQISSESQLKRIGNDPSYTTSSHYVLTSDIVLTPIEEDGEILDGTWTPIENFSGVFDGAFHSIYSMKITDSTLKGSRNAGFIGSLVNNVQTSQDNVNNAPAVSEPKVLSMGVVKNLILRDVNINVSTVDYLGCVVALNYGEIHTSQAYGKIINNGDQAYVGGVAGKISRMGDRPVVDRCSFEGGINIADSTSIAGGIVGYNECGTVSESFYATNDNANSVENGNNWFAGVVGVNYGGEEKANVYDNFFYIASIHESDNHTSNTNFEKMAGVIYTNMNAENTNNVRGNYFGGLDNMDIVTVATGSFVDNRYNSYLARSEFSRQDIVNTKFVNYITADTHEVKTWAFGSVWSLGQLYPILNIHSISGSIYVDRDDIMPDTDITNVEEFLDAVLGLKNYDSKLFSISASELDLSGVVIGSQDYPIADSLLGLDSGEIGALISTAQDGTTIKNLTIVNNVSGANVGLARVVLKDVYVSNIKFDGVTISGEKGNFVGVLAGESKGANINNVDVSNVACSIDGTSFGGLFGMNRYESGHAITNVDIYNVSCENNRFFFAGGVVGYNYGDILGNDNNRSTVQYVRLSGNYTGGVAGVNITDKSFIRNYDVANLYFTQPISGNTSTGKIYSGDVNVSGSGDLFIGGIAGRNYGTISKVYAKSHIEAYAYTTLSNHKYSVYVGGIAGINQNIISDAYVVSSKLKVYENGNVFIGGLVGFNYSGKISKSVVDRNTELEADTTLTVPPTADNLFEYHDLSMVGGLVGYDYYTSQDYSIYLCSSKAKSIKGFYAAGLVAIEFGKMLQCECGDMSRTGGGVSITGFMSAGLCVLAKSGVVSDCYTACELNCTTYSDEYTYDNILSVVGRRVSGTAGLILVADANVVVRGCYTVAEFVELNKGVSFSGFGYSNNAAITGNIYLNAGNKDSTAGTNLSEAELRGSDNYAKFMAKIGSEDNSIWYTGYGYPIIKYIDDRCTESVLPSYLG